MANSIVTSNLQNSSTSKFPTGVKNRRLSLILQETKEGTSSDWRKIEGFMYAAKEGHINAMKYLVEHGVDFHLNQKAALEAAVTKGCLNMVKFLCKEEVGDKYDYSYLFRIAISRGHLEILKYFVHERLVNILHEDRKISLVTLASGCNQLETVKFLIQEGADLHKGDESALITAAEAGYFALVQYLLHEGANIHAQEEGALRCALEKGHFLLVLYLVRQGADIRNPKVEEMLTTVQGTSPEKRFLCEMLGYS